MTSDDPARDAMRPGSAPGAGTPPSTAPSPDAGESQQGVALRIILGTRLRQLRETVGVSANDAGDAIRGSAAKISRLERGRVGLKWRDVRDLLILYGVSSPDEVGRWSELVDRSNATSWDQPFADVLPDWFENYLRLERAAAAVRKYDVQFVPGLLQTEDYARALVAQQSIDPQEIDRRVQVRLSRQELLNGRQRPAFRMIIDEAAVRRRYASADVQRGQIRHLLEVSAQPSVTVQILPFDVGGHATGGSFSLLRFEERDLPDVVYLEQLDSAVYLDRKSDVDAYVDAMNALVRRAATPEASRDLLRRVLQEF